MDKKVNVTVMLKHSNGDTTEHEVDLMAVQDCGIVFDHLTQKHFIFTKVGGRFFTAPIFEESKVLVLNRNEDETELVPVDRSLLEAACKEIRSWKVSKGGDDQVVLNLEAALGKWTDA